MKRPSPIALVADSQELFSHSLMRLLEQHIDYPKVITTTTFADSMSNLLAHPNIVFAAFELHLPGMDGLTSIAGLRSAYPQLRIAVIAESTDRNDILRALAVGIHGYIPRSLALSEAIQALTTISGGHIYVPSAMSNVPDTKVEQRHDGMNGLPPGQSVENLTSRQKQILGLIAQGRSNKQIATSLSLAEGTVKAHVTAIFRALGIHDRASAAAIAAASRILDGSADIGSPDYIQTAK